MTSPARPDVDALLKAARSRIAAMRIAPCSGIASSRAAADELERALDALATPASGEAAEGAGKPDCTLSCQMHQYDGVCCADDDCDIELGVRAPPRTAPDAMREALRDAREYVEKAYEKSHHAYDKAALDDINDALAAPVPSPDGTREPFAWVVLSAETGNTRMWTRNGDIAKVFAAKHLLECVELYRTPSDAGAAEPVSFQFRQRSGVGKGPQSQASWGDWCGIERADYESYLHAPNKLIEVRSLYAAPPVRGDREQIARAMYEADDPNGSWVHEVEDTKAFFLKLADVRLSLPVQSSADARIDKAYAEGVRACLRRLEHLRKLADDTAWKDCEAMWRNRIAEVELSRQPSPSTDGDSHG